MTETAQDFQYDLGGTEPASQLGGFEPIPSDLYEARVLDPELGASRAGNTQIKFEWQVIEGEYAGRRVRDQITFTPKSGPFVLAYMVALGLQRPTAPVGKNALAAYVVREIAGKRAQITVGIRSYQNEAGETKYANEIINLAPLGVSGNSSNSSGPVDQVSEEELADVPF